MSELTLILTYTGLLVAFGALLKDHARRVERKVKKLEEELKDE